MIGKIKEFWQVLDEKQQVYALVFSVVLAVGLLIVLLYLPIQIQNQVLNTQLQVQSDISQKLINISTKRTNFISVGRKKAKSIVDKIAKQKGLTINLKLDDDKLRLNAKNQAFDGLKNLLLSLRQQYAITTIKANIIKTKDGFVNADLTLLIP